MEKVAIAVLGCGRIGRMHARVLARHPRTRLIAVYDVMADAAAETARELGVQAAASVAAVLADPALRAVLIATPTPTHVDLIIAAAQAGKAILCEKPIDLDMARVRACQQAIAPLAPIVMIGFNRRFDPSFQALRRRAEAGEIGAIEQVVITSRDPAPPPAHFVRDSGGLFRDMTIHDFDMARSLVGDIVEVQAMGACLIDPAIGAAGDIDSAMVQLRARSGAMVHINNSRRSAYGYDQRLEVFGAKGMLIAENRRATTVRASLGAATEAADPVLPFFIERYAEAYAAEIGHFIDCLANGTTPATSFADGVAALAIADAALESMRRGASVRLD
ncbi:MAG: inositol 2-dehydrogenase [Rhodospirillales bacterium]|nr:inositol 2-dehydrogenase [Rhodospirillales bacterium]